MEHSEALSLDHALLRRLQVRVGDRSRRTCPSVGVGAADAVG